jgi:hypothetical protein
MKFTNNILISILNLKSPLTLNKSITSVRHSFTNSGSIINPWTITGITDGDGSFYVSISRSTKNTTPPAPLIWPMGHAEDSRRVDL